MTGIQLIREEPSKTDELGAHTRVAQALATLLASDASARTIGLLGRWGSGKSTTVNISQGILQSAAQDGPKPLFFVYDAWAQQSDPPRRAFLEALVLFLSSSGVAQPGAWQDDIDLLVRRTEIHDIKTTPTLTPWGLSLAVALAVVPIGILLSRATDWWHHIGNLLLFSPLVVVALSRFWGTIVAGTDKTAARSADSTAMLFFNKTVDRVRNTIMKSPEPTSLEFRDQFYKIISNDQVKKKLLVIIVDNLDRISTEDALTMWAAIRGLMEGGSKTFATNTNFKVVVPFDQTAIQKLFEDEKDEDRSVVAARSRAFVEKTFDATLLVGPPIDSDWRAYLESALLKCFGDGATATERLHIARIFEALLSTPREPFETTPRRLNSFVNSIGTIRMQWGSDLMFASIAYFSARNIWADSSLKDVLLDDAPGASLMDRLAKDWRMEVAAIHYGVAPDKARQLIVEPEIAKTIQAGDEEKFGELSNLPGFTKTLDGWLQVQGTSDFNRVGWQHLLNAASLMQASLPDTPETAEAWVAIRGACRRAGVWDQPTHHAKRGSEAMRARGIETSSLVLPALVHVKSTKLEPSAWLESLDAILPDQGRSQLLRSAKAPFEGLGYISLLEAASMRGFLDNHRSLRLALAPREPLEDVIAIFETTVGTEDPNLVLHALRGLVSLPQKWDFDRIANALEARALAAPELLSPLCEALITIGDAAKAALARLADSGSLAHLFADATESKDTRGQAIAVFGLTFRRGGKLSGDTSRGNAAKGWELLQNLDETLGHSSSGFTESFSEISSIKNSFNKNNDATSLRFLLEVSKQPGWVSLLKNQLTMLIRDGSLGRQGYTEIMFNHAHQVSQILSSAEYLKYIRLISSFTDWEEALDDPNEVSFWSAASAITGQKAVKVAALSDRVEKRFSTLTSHDWADLISSPPQHMDMMLSTLGKSMPKAAKDAFIDGFEKWVGDYVSGASSLTLSESQASRLLQLLPVGKRRIWSKTLAEYLQSVDPDRAIDGLVALGAALTADADSRELQDALARKVVLRSILSGSEAGKDKIALHWPAVASIIRGASAEVREDIAQRTEWLGHVAEKRGTTEAALVNEFADLADGVRPPG